MNPIISEWGDKQTLFYSFLRKRNKILTMIQANTSINRLPNCLSMDIKGERIFRFPNLFAKRDEYKQIDLFLTIRFNEHWYDLPGGRIRFGINGGQLTLKLENGEIPLDLIDLSGPFNLAVSVKRVKKDTTKGKKGVKVSAQGGEISQESEETAEYSDEISFIACQVTTKGTNTNPVWVFEEKQEERVLKGLLKSAKLATMNILAKPCVVRAEFDISNKNIQITDFEGIWFQNITPGKRITIDRMIVNALLKEVVQTHLSEQVLKDE